MSKPEGIKCAISGGQIWSSSTNPDNEARAFLLSDLAARDKDIRVKALEEAARLFENDDYYNSKMDVVCPEDMIRALKEVGDE